MTAVYAALALRILWRGRVWTKSVEELPDGLGPMETGYLLTCRLTREDVMAGILSLAQKGALLIHAPRGLEPTKFELQSIDSATDLTQSEIALDRLLSQYGGMITPQLLSRSPGTTTSDDPAAFLFLNTLCAKVEDALEKEGHLSNDELAGCLAAGAVFAFFVTSFSVLAYLHSYALLTVVLIVAAIAGPASLKEKRLTGKGVLARSKAFTLRRHISRLAHSSNDQLAPEQAVFEKYLPFATACGFGWHWCSAFAAKGLSSPDWLFTNGEWFGSLDSSMSSFQEHVGQFWASRRRRPSFWNSTGPLPGTPPARGNW